ncbi:MAG TPA: LysM peptidoglycan-binding domain-containing protein [Myxococcota bacterium]|nr:LysM peptidoglycan-binding domain-containing protein [Myxococcota bacterium]HQP96052.1 LysM peptidoglycan-binding domain-containing protein [Myxococcota bacterium]
MRLHKLIITVLIVVVCGGCGSRKDRGKQVEPARIHASELPEAPSDPFVLKGNDSVSRVQQQVVDGEVKDNIIILTENDTLTGLSSWFKISVEALVEDNRWVEDTGLVAGKPFIIRMPGDQFLSLVRARDATGTDIKPVEIERVEEYIVKPGETASSIARQFGVPLSLLEGMNPYSKSFALKPGQIIKIPILKGSGECQAGIAADKKNRGTERCPGPRAPNPTPVPMPPPAEPRNLLVDTVPAD